MSSNSAGSQKHGLCPWPGGGAPCACSEHPSQVRGSLLHCPVSWVALTQLPEPVSHPGQEEDPEALGGLSVGGGLSPQGPPTTPPSTPASCASVPRVDALRQWPPATLQLVHLLAQLLNLFGQAALCQGRGREGREGQGGQQCWEKQRNVLRSAKPGPRPGPQVTPEARSDREAPRRWAVGRQAGPGRGSAWGRTGSRPAEPSHLA